MITIRIVRIKYLDDLIRSKLDVACFLFLPEFRHSMFLSLLHFSIQRKLVDLSTLWGEGNFRVDR